MKKKTCLLVGFIILFTLPLTANNISIDGTVTLTEQNAADNYTHFKFDIAWDNSWRLDGVAAPNNWDAAWVFAKFNVVDDEPDNGWKHCTLNTSGHTAHNE